MRSLIFIFFSLLFFNVQAEIELREFQTSEQEILYQQMLKELRCVVCQNQNLAESNAPIAKDLRDQLYKLITEKSADKAAINQYMTERYGDFVLYNPPLQPNTWLLWFAPILLLALAIWLAASFIRASQNPDKSTENAEREINA